MMMMMQGMNVGPVIGNLQGRQLAYPYNFRRNLDDLKEQVEKLGDARRRLLQFVDEAERQGNEISPDVGKWLAHAEEKIRQAEALIEDEKMTKKKCFNGLCPDLKSRYELSKKAKKLAYDIVKIREANDFGGVSGTKPAPFRNYEASKSRNPISIVSIAAEYFAIPFGGQLVYLLQYKSNIAGLMEQVEKLREARQRVQVSVDEARGQGNGIFPDVPKWLIHAEEMIQKVEKLKEDGQSTNNRCFNGRYLNLESRYELSKEAKKLAGLLVKIIQETDNFDRVSYQLPPQGIGAELVQDYEALESRMWILNEIMDALRDDELNMIGIWGMVGVGKTILAKQAAIQAQENMLFDEVVIVRVSLTPSLMQIQEQIASVLGLRLEQENESLRANLLYKILKNKNRILIILDDIWAELDLRKVGIPWGDDHPGCKIVLTSRDLFVLSNEMATQRNFRVQHLSEEEAWRLFEKTAGDSIEKSDLRSIAIEVAKECAGLPLAVVSIAKALKHEDPAMWKQALQQLRRSIMTSFEEFSDKLYSTANLSYIHLNNDEIKSLLLLCGLIANDAGTDVLLEYVIGLALFEGVNTLEEATNRLQSLLHDLRSASLLLGCEDDKRVIMHGVLRDLAIEIASRERHWLVREDVPSEEWSKTDEIEIATEDDHWLAREGVRLEEWSKTDEAAECTCISLNLRHIHELPDEQLVCPQLKIFRLSCKEPYLEIRTNFFEFEGMKELQVLDLSGMHFLSLPSSLGFLQNLRTLRLHKCALKNISMISKLTKLEVLSLVHSNVSKFPREMAELTRLRLLDLCNCSQLKEIPYNTISKFSQLEKLCMENSFTQWEVDGDHASVAELKFLSQLMILDVKIPDASLLPQGELLGNLMRFRIFIGDVWDWYGNYETSRTLKLNNFDTGLHLVDVISKLLKRTEDLCLRELSGTKNLLNLDREGFRELQYLHVQNSPEIQFIINSVDGLPADGAFPVLKSLLLDNLIRLEGVCHGRLPVGSFCNLRFLTIENCSSLLTVAPPNLLPGLQNLEVLDVRACNLLKEVFNFEGLDTHNVHVGGLPKLKELKLIDLPELKHICKKGLPRTEEITVQEGAEEAVEDFPELTSLSIESLSSLASFYTLRRPGIPIPALFDERVTFPKLEYLKLSLQLPEIQDLQVLFGALSNLKILIVENCPFLSSLFSPNFVQCSNNLKMLTVKECGQLEEVFDLKGLDHGDDKHVEMLSKLEEVSLIGLPKLRYICNNSPQQVLSLQNLKLLLVKQCHSLMYLFSPSMVSALVQLQDLEIEDCEKMEGIFAVEGRDSDNGPQVVSSFQNLKLLRVKQCHSWMYLFPFSVALGQLQELHIERCSKMEKIIMEDVDMDNMPQGLSLQNLKFVWMKQCDRLMYLFSASMALNLEQLQDLCIEDCPMMKEIVTGHERDFDNQSPQISSFQNLKFMQVKQCDSLMYLFPSSMALALVQLQDLRIENCDAMKEIIREDGDIDDMDPKLSCFQNLKFMQVKQCASLMYLFPSSMVLALVQLQDLKIENCDAMKEIIREDGDIDNMVPKLSCFQNLKFMQVKQCASLMYLFPSSMALALVQLQDLKIENCDAMKEIIREDGDIDNMDPKLSCFQNLKFMQVKQCDSLMYLFLSSMALALVQLQDLQIENCDAIEEIIREDGDIDNMNPKVSSFQNLKSVQVKQCHSLMYLFPFSIALALVQLQDLCIENCDAMEEIIREDRYMDNRDPKVWSFRNLKSVQVKQCHSLIYLFPYSIALALVQLQDLGIENCNAMEEIIKKVSDIDNKDPKVSSFQNLKSVQVKQCHSLMYLFPPSIALALGQLQELRMENCSTMKQIVITDEEVTNKIIFCQIIRLSLLDLPELTSFYLGQDPEKTRTGDSNSAHGLLFNEEVTFPSLEDLHLFNLHNVKNIWHNEFISDSFGKLKRLFVRSCQKPKNIIPSNMLKRLPNLQILKIADCYSVEEVFDLEAIDSKESHDIPAFQLRELCLDNLKNLKYVWNKAPEGLLTYQSLNHVKVCHCPSLKIPFPGYVVRNLLQVKELGTTACGVEEIVAHEDVAEVVTMFLFPEVTSLESSRLDELKCFYLGLDALKWPMLKTLKVESHESLEELAFKLDKDVEQPIFLCDKVAFSSLENLDISNLDTMETIWHNKFIADSFGKLKRLSIRSCQRMRSVIPSNMLKSLSSLQILEIVDCDSVEEVFDLKALNRKESHDILVLELRELCLDNLKNLQYIWNKAPQELLTFESLEPIKVSHCPSLEVPFPGYMVRSLLQLKESNKNSSGGGKIVAGVREAKAGTMLFFPEVTSLSNSCLKELECFYLVLQTLEWQALKTIEVVGCESLEMLASKLHKRVENPIFLCNKFSCPSLEELEISNLDTMEKIWHNEFIVDSFGKLKRLSIRSCQNMRSVIPFNMLKSMSSLQILEIVDCDSVEEVFDLEAFDGKESHDILAFQLRELCLDNLKNLKYIWSEAPQALLNYQSLEPIKVSRCPSLEVPFPGYVVRNLLQLKGLNKNSHGGGKIVANVREAKAVSMLLFPEVTSLTNSCLKELECFYLGLHSLEWPELKTLMVEGFESRKLLASKDGPVENSILLCDKVAFPSLENLDISYLDTMETIWHNEFIAKTIGKLKGMFVRSCHKMRNIISSNMLKRLSNLQILEIQDCTSVAEVFDLNAVDSNDVLGLQLGKLCLDNLKNLKYIWNKAPHGLITYQSLNTVKISHCPSLEIPFPGYVVRSLLQLKDLLMNSPAEWENVEHVSVAKAGTMFLFPKVTSLTNSYNKGLKCFYLGVHTLQWQALETLEVECSESLELFASKPVEDPVFLCDKAAFPNLECLNLSIDVKEIQHLDLLFEPLPNLKTLKVENCPFIWNLFSSDFVKGLTNLQNLTVQKCEQLQVVIDLSGLHHAEGKHIEVLSRLEDLKLSDLPELKSICKNSPPKGLCFPKLKWLGVKQCGSLTHLFSSSIVSGLSQLQDIRVEHCSMVEQIVMAEEGVTDKISFPQITGVTLLKLPKLESFYQRTRTPGLLFNEEVLFPQLENLNVSGLDNVKGIWHNKLLADSFGKLKRAEVENCKELQSISSSIVLNWLPSLEFLKVACCAKLTEVFYLEVINVQEDVTCYRLDLVLDDLQKLEHICNKVLGKKLCLQNLKSLKVHNCGSMKRLFSLYMESKVEKEFTGQEESKVQKEITRQEDAADVVIDKIEFPELTSLSLKSLLNLECLYPGNHDTHITVLFDEKVAFPSLESLEISDLPNMKKIWYNKLIDNSFGKLEKMVVEKCKELPNVLSSDVLKGLTSLHVLRIVSCHKLKEVFDLEGADNILEDETATKLNHLVLQDLPELEHIWNKDPYGILAFQNLDLVEVYDCQLQSHFPSSSLVRNLSQLEKQLIRSRRPEEFGEGFVFPKVASDKLLDLRKIKGKEVVKVHDYVNEISEDMPGSSG